MEETERSQPDLLQTDAVPVHERVFKLDDKELQSAPIPIIRDGNGPRRDESAEAAPHSRYTPPESTEEKCQRWLDTSSSIVSEEDLSTTYSEDTTATEDVLKISNIDLNYDKVTRNYDGHKVVHEAGKDINENQILQIIEGNNNLQSFKNVQIIGSKNVHVGNITVVQYINSNGKGGGATVAKENNKPHKLIKDEVIEPASRIFRVIERNGWLAQPPMDKAEALSTPVRYVIICHTATESGQTQAKNVLLIRNIQTFHIESRNWDDIGYNFLIGSDGLVYEGRGWDSVGAHTYGWNSKALGIAFVGCFIKTMPPEKSLEMCKRLLERGVALGKIDKDYELLGHCQTQPIESPGRLLYEEIQKWDHWSKEHQKQ